MRAVVGLIGLSGSEIWSNKNRSGKGNSPMAAEHRICRSSSTRTELPVAARNVAELLRDLGLILRWGMRRGAGTNRVSLLLQFLCWESQLALEFLNLRASVQLRAMVEDWPLHRIQEAVQVQRCETLRPQHGSPTRLSP